jgi:tRNA-splicing ligase RtcB
MDDEIKNCKPVTIIGTPEIRKTFDEVCLRQAISSRHAPGVSNLVLNPDGHRGYGAPVGCVMVSPDHLYPGPVGPDISCSMSFLQFDLPESEIKDRAVRRMLIDQILMRIPTGPGADSRNVPLGRDANMIANMAEDLLLTGAHNQHVVSGLGIDNTWLDRCEDIGHLIENDGPVCQLIQHLSIKKGQQDWSRGVQRMKEKVTQIGSYGGGNHFGECQVVRVVPGMEKTAEVFGLKNGCVGFLSHCGSRGVGFALAAYHFASLQGIFKKWSIPFPGDDKELVYAPEETNDFNGYRNAMWAGQNFAILNHLLINTLVKEAFEVVFPGIKANFVYHISHNIARQEVIDGRMQWVHRKGATRAYPPGHFSLSGTPFEESGHPILLPGNPVNGSSIMVAEPGAHKAYFSVNHGAGRVLGRKAAERELNQAKVDREFEDHDILSNCREYPVDEAPAAYKDFREVLASIELAGLAKEVARLDARFVIKDTDNSKEGSA